MEWLDKAIGSESWFQWFGSHVYWHVKNCKVAKSAPNEGILNPSSTKVHFDIELGQNQV